MLRKAERAHNWSGECTLNECEEGKDLDKESGERRLREWGPMCRVWRGMRLRERRGFWIVDGWAVAKMCGGEQGDFCSVLRISAVNGWLYIHLTWKLAGIFLNAVSTSRLPPWRERMVLEIRGSQCYASLNLISRVDCRETYLPCQHPCQQSHEMSLSLKSFDVYVRFQRQTDNSTKIPSSSLSPSRTPCSKRDSLFR